MINFEMEKIDKNIVSVIKEILPDKELLSFLNGGSKRIRAKLAILLVKAFGCNVDSVFIDILTVGELIHNASLLHDDVIDDSELRRGVTTLGKKYSSNISILCGDYVVSNAIKILLKLNNIEISNIFNNCVKNMSVAEIKQYFQRGNEGKCGNIDDYIEITNGKTAGLFSTILESSALHFNLDRELFKKFGELFGICFQIKNDLEVYSAQEDKKNQVCTIVDILGIENAKILSDNYKQELRVLLENVPENSYRLELEDIINKL